MCVCTQFKYIGTNLELIFMIGYQLGLFVGEGRGV